MILTTLISAAVALPGCTSSKKNPLHTTRPAKVESQLLGGAAIIPKATIIKIDPEYADKVGVTLNPDGTLLYFPAPTDISPGSAPVALGRGWWLNRQGLSGSSVFTNWTFKAYSSFTATPSPAEIKAHIIPGSCVEEIITLPIDINRAADDPAGCAVYVPQ